MPGRRRARVRWAVVTASPVEDAPTVRRARGKPVRAEIQALRALAVALVVVCHTWPSALPGGFVGVDVFFVISGFLITGQLLGEVGRTGSVSLTGFWARRGGRGRAPPPLLLGAGGRGAPA